MTTDRAEPQQPSLFHRMGEALQHLVGCADCATDQWTRCQNGGQDALAALHEYEEFAASPAPDPAQEAAPVDSVQLVHLLECAYARINNKGAGFERDWRQEALHMIRNVADTLRASPPAAPVAKQINEDDYVDIPSHDSFDPPPIARSAADEELVARGFRWGSMATELHPRTRDLIARFATALAEKLAAAERKYGYSDGWAHDGWMDECRAKLIEHVAKGDPRDVAAYCAFLWHHGERTAAPVGSQQSGSGEATVTDAMVDVACEIAIANGQPPPRSVNRRTLVYMMLEAALAAQNSPPASGVGEQRCSYVRSDGKQCVYVAGHLAHHIYDDQINTASSDTQARVGE